MILLFGLFFIVDVTLVILGDKNRSMSGFFHYMTLFSSIDSAGAVGSDAGPKHDATVKKNCVRTFDAHSLLPGVPMLYKCCSATLK